MITEPFLLLKEGGKWLAATRKYLQNWVPGGERVIWGTNMELTLTVRQIEELAAEAVAADRRDRLSPRKCDERRWKREGRKTR